MNKVIVTGNIAAEPTYRNDEHTVLAFPFAVENTVRTEDGYDTEPSFLNMVIFGNYAKALTFLEKGQRCAIEAHVKTSTYEDKDGKKRQSVDFVVDEIEASRKAQKDAEPAA